MLPNLCRQILHFCASYINTNCFSWYFRLKTWYLILFITSDPSLVSVLGQECNKFMFRAMSCPWFYSNFSNKPVPDCYGFVNSTVPWVRKNHTISEVLVYTFLRQFLCTVQFLFSQHPSIHTLEDVYFFKTRCSSLYWNFWDTFLEYYYFVA